MAIEEPDMNAWLAQAKESEQAPNIGMFLIHNGIVRATPRHAVRAEAARPAEAPERDARVVAVDFSYDKAGLEAALKEALSWEGVYYVQAWLNEGRVEVGESLMYVLIGADIRPHAISALEKLVGHIKSQLNVNSTLSAQRCRQARDMQPCAGEVALQLAVSYANHFYRKERA